MAALDDEPAAVRLALRVAFTATACLVVSEWLQLGQRSLSVYSAHMAMVLFPYSAFQKTVERVVGRLLGVFYGLLAVVLFAHAPLVLVGFMLLGQMVFFYIYASGRLAYAALMGGLFMGVVVALGLTTPTQVWPYTRALAGQLILAAVLIVLVNWLTGAERTLAIETGEGALWPPRHDWLSKAAMVSTAQILAMFVALWFGLPTLPTMISTAILAITTSDPLGMGQKAYLRALGAVLGGGYALISMFLLAYLPDFLMLAALVFFGMFIAAYYTRTAVTNSYAFMQMGLALPMVLIGTDGTLGTMSTAILRLVGVGAGLLVAEAVLIAWPQSTLIPAPAPAPMPEPATADGPSR